MCNGEIKVLHNSFILIFLMITLSPTWRRKFGLTDALTLTVWVVHNVYQVVPYQGHVWKMLICCLGFLSVKIRAPWLLHVKIPLRR